MMTLGDVNNIEKKKDKFIDKLSSSRKDLLKLH